MHKYAYNSQTSDSFKNNDNLFFSVYTPDGMLLKTLENDTTSPFSPLAHLQISATKSSILYFQQKNKRNILSRKIKEEEICTRIET